MWIIPQQVENVTAYLKQEDLDKQMGNICLNGKYNILTRIINILKNTYLFRFK